MTARIAGVITAALIAVTRALAAQVSAPSGELPLPVPAAAQPCTGCHRPAGQGNPAAGVPRIAGQSQYYIAKQLRSYANGTRQSPAMEAIAGSLSARDVAVVAAYFAQSVAPAMASAATGNTHLRARGRTLAQVGSAERRVAACSNCHGPDGAGEPPASPYLAGLDAAYLTASLAAWKTGTRSNDAGQQMAVVVQALTAEDMAAVAEYYASLSPPPPAPLNLVQTPTARTPAPTVPVTASTVPVTAPVASLNAPTAGDASRGRAILASGVHGCAACHAIPGVRGANGVVGPPLGGLARRGFLAGQLPNRRDVLIAFLQDPPALVTATGMPNVGVSRADARDIAAYLYTLDAPH